MKKIAIRSVCVVLVLSLLLSFAACGASMGVRSTISSFQEACNTMDVEAAIECLDPSISGVLNFGAGLVGMFTGKSNEELFSALSDFLGKSAENFGVDSFKTLDIDVTDVATNEETADAKATLTYKGMDGAERTNNVTFRLKADDEGEWKISGISFK